MMMRNISGFGTVRSTFFSQTRHRASKAAINLFVLNTISWRWILPDPRSRLSRNETIRGMGVHWCPLKTWRRSALGMGRNCIPLLKPY